MNYLYFPFTSPVMMLKKVFSKNLKKFNNLFSLFDVWKKKDLI